MGGSFSYQTVLPIAVNTVIQLTFNGRYENIASHHLHLLPTGCHCADVLSPYCRPLHDEPFHVIGETRDELVMEGTMTVQSPTPVEVCYKCHGQGCTQKEWTSVSPAKGQAEMVVGAPTWEEAPGFELVGGETTEAEGGYLLAHLDHLEGLQGWGVSECKRKCETIPSCVGFTFNTTGASERLDGARYEWWECWLTEAVPHDVGGLGKNSERTFWLRPGAATKALGYVIERGAYYNWNYVREQVSTYQSPGECALYCNQLQWCKSFLYNLESHLCGLCPYLPTELPYFHYSTHTRNPKSNPALTVYTKTMLAEPVAMDNYDTYMFVTIPGHDLAHLRNVVPKLCAEACSGTEDCGGFEADANSEECWLKTMSAVQWGGVRILRHEHIYYSKRPIGGVRAPPQLQWELHRGHWVENHDLEHHAKYTGEECRLRCVALGSECRSVDVANGGEGDTPTGGDCHVNDNHWTLPYVGIESNHETQCWSKQGWAKPAPLKVYTVPTHTPGSGAFYTLSEYQRRQDVLSPRRSSGTRVGVVGVALGSVVVLVAIAGVGLVLRRRGVASAESLEAELLAVPTA